MKVFSKVTIAVCGLMLLSVAVWAALKYELTRSLFSTDFLAHQYCYLRQPQLIWANAVSDGFIWLSYIAIAVGLASLLCKTQTLLSFRWMFVAFGLFIVACGFTHFFEMVTIWKPLYWLSTSVKMLTALASITTAIAFVQQVPSAARAIRLFHEAYSKSEHDRVETTSKLLDAEERIKLAVESAGVATWEWNLESKELIWDERCRAIFGVPNNGPLRYEDFFHRLHPEDRAHTQALVDTALKCHTDYNAVFRIIRDDGEIRTVISRGKAFCNGEGQPFRFIGTVVDITRERQAEEALVKAEKLAVAGRMAASIAHEIHNPLDAASGLLYLCKTDENVPQQTREYLKLVDEELQRAARITRSTLTFYRESPNPVPIDVVELVNSVLEFQQTSIRKAGVTVDSRLVNSNPILAFPGELRQIFTNLISNAVEAMRGDGKLVVGVHPARDWRTGQDGYSFVVGDNGPGISPEIRKKLFEAFYTTKGEKGTGLGLWITSQLVQKHGGSIKLRSRYSPEDGNSGTVFSVWLPLRHDFTV